MMVTQKPQKVTLRCLLRKQAMPQKRMRKSKTMKTRRRPAVSFMSYQPRSALIEFPHVWRGTLSESAAGLGIVNTFRANSLFDPDFTGVGAQPLGFDQWSTLYSTYRVISCKYEVTFSNGTGGSCVVGLVKSPNSSLSGSSSWIIERDSSSKTLGPNSGAGNVARFSGTLLPWQVLNVTKQQYMMDGRTNAAMTGNPTVLAYLHTFVLGFGTIASASILVKLKYRAQLINRTEFDLS